MPKEDRTERAVHRRRRLREGNLASDEDGLMETGRGKVGSTFKVHFGYHRRH